MEASITAIPGQFITFDLPIGEKRLQRWKSYSIANFITDGKIELCVGKLEGGLGSTYLCETVQIGDTLKFKGLMACSAFQKPSLYCGYDLYRDRISSIPRYASTCTWKK
jgi:NAD(P)H-flavin reductase